MLAPLLLTELCVCWLWAGSASALMQLTVLGFIWSPVYLVGPHLPPGCRRLMEVQLLLLGGAHSSTGEATAILPLVSRMDLSQA